MRRPGDHPEGLAELLETLAGRLRKVDLRLIEEIRAMWPHIVEPALAQHCRPEFVKNGVLLVSVPSGAFAQRVNTDSARILAGFAPLGERAPTSLRTVLAKS